ncbi:MAG: family 43 glycosylhydrolase [Bacteroidota bacterium]
MKDVFHSFKKYPISWLLTILTSSCQLKTTPRANQTVIQGFKNGNPLVLDVGMADPHIKIFNSKPYLYATRDADKTAQGFIMPEWTIWETDDLIHWELATTILPTETYMGESKSCWATDAEYRNGKYYFYFSNGNVDTGVMTASRPTGPFKDALGKPFLPKDLTPTKEYDPTILIDDDPKKTPYIVFGHYRSVDPDLNFMIAKLGEDMITLAEKPRVIEIEGAIQVLAGNDKPTLHKHNGIYYLSAGSHYAISSNVYGPYTRMGNSGNNEYGLSSRAHGNYFDWNGQSFHTWCHFHLGKEVARYRESYISYLHYKNNGEMVTDTDYLDAHFNFGVGQYDADWNKIEAEWYMKAANVEKKESPTGGFEILETTNKGYISFPNIYNLDNKSSIAINASSLGGSTIEIRANSIDGKLLATCAIPETGDWKRYVTTEFHVADLKSVNELFFIFDGNVNHLAHLDWFSFDAK